eukprot:scaffold5888_cov118-Isochrysis_galbana.AAC.4
MSDAIASPAPLGPVTEESTPAPSVGAGPGRGKRRTQAHTGPTVAAPCRKVSDSALLGMSSAEDE